MVILLSNLAPLIVVDVYVLWASKTVSLRQQPYRPDHVLSQ
jgi:hypothetical protein